MFVMRLTMNSSASGCGPKYQRRMPMSQVSKSHNSRDVNFLFSNRRLPWATKPNLP